MKLRLAVNDKGQLIDRGRIVGQIVAMTVDLALDIKTDADSMGRQGAAEQVSLDPSLDVGLIERVWSHYQRVVPGGERFTLEQKRRRYITQALAVRPLETVLLALDGLAASDFHNGANEQKKKYLGIQYALHGFGTEGNDERIDKMAALAGEPQSTDFEVLAAPVLKNALDTEEIFARANRAVRLLQGRYDSKPSDHVIASGDLDWLRKEAHVEPYLDHAGRPLWRRV